MLLRHQVLLFYECIIAALFIYLTFEDSYGVLIINTKENTTARHIHVFNNQSTNISR